MSINKEYNGKEVSAIRDSADKHVGRWRDQEGFLGTAAQPKALTVTFNWLWIVGPN